MKRILVFVLFCAFSAPLVIGSIAGRESTAPSSVVDKTPVEPTVPQFAWSGSPLAKIGESKFDFGTVDPLLSHRHTFEIHNAGTAPLSLSRQGTSCQCLEVEVQNATVLPGDVGRVDVVWNALPKQDIFLQRATLRTNDPSQLTIDLVVEGKARVLLGAQPASLEAPRIKPDRTTTLETVVVSQVWEQFTLSDIQPSLAGVTCAANSLTPEELKSLDVKSGWRLTVTLPRGMPPGEFREQLRFVARPDNGAEAIERTIPLEGKVLRGLTVYGDDIDIFGTITAGTIDSRRGYNKAFVLKVSDDQPELVVTKVDANPDYVQARIEPFGDGSTPGIYRLWVHIPPTDVPAAYTGDHPAKLTMHFDHPRLKSLELGVEFVVLNSAQQRIEKPKSELRLGRKEP